MRYHATGQVHITGAGTPTIEFRLSVPAESDAEARKAIEPLLAGWPHVILDVDTDQEPRQRVERELPAGVDPDEVSYCVICGCDDYHACRDVDGEGCRWIALRQDLHAGLCSVCATYIGANGATVQSIVQEREAAQG